MKTVRISDELYEEALQALLSRGILKFRDQKNPNPTKVIETVVSLILYKEEDIETGRQLVSRREINPLEEDILSFAKTSRALADASTSVKPAREKLQEELSKVLQDEAEKKYDTGHPLYRDPSVEDPLPRRTISADTEPWEGLERCPIADIHLRYPKHPLLKWSFQDDLKTIAVEVAFATVPMALHKTGTVISLAETLYGNFVTFRNIAKTQKNT